MCNPTTTLSLLRRTNALIGDIHGVDGIKHKYNLFSFYIKTFIHIYIPVLQRSLSLFFISFLYHSFIYIFIIISIIITIHPLPIPFSTNQNKPFNQYTTNYTTTIYNKYYSIQFFNFAFGNFSEYIPIANNKNR